MSKNHDITGFRNRVLRFAKVNSKSNDINMKVADVGKSINSSLWYFSGSGDNANRLIFYGENNYLRMQDDGRFLSVINIKK